jgi:hypothetical protein
MKPRIRISASLAIAGLVLVAGIDVSRASISSTAPASTLAQFGSQRALRLAEVTPASKPKSVKRTTHPHKAGRGPGINWLNPQPEPPMSAKKPGQGGNWLNPQPEPPRPVTQKKLH